MGGCREHGWGLGGVIATFAPVLDLIAFVLFLVFVFASSIIVLRRGDRIGGRPMVEAG